MLQISKTTLAFLAFSVAILAAWYAAHIELSHFVSDDGGICLRYAERIAHGKGFNYNDGQNVNGASCVLFTLLLALPFSLGLAPAAAISSIAIPAFAATAGLLFWTFARYWSLYAAFFCLCAFGSVEFLFDYQFDALETTFVMMLAAALFHSLHTESRLYQGIVLGLLVANKLDGAFASLAFALIWLATKRAFPWRVASIAFAVALPVWLLLLVQFGSILPQSAATKLFMSAESRGPFDPMWVCRTLATLLPLLCLPALLSFLIPWSARNRLALRTVQVWFAVHVVAYSTIDLSAPFPWYCSLPAFLIVVLATISVDSIYTVAVGPLVTPAIQGRAAWTRRARRALAFIALLAFIWISAWPAIRGRLPRETRDERLMPNSASEIGRGAIGAWLRKHTSGTELLSTAYGLTSFEYKGPVDDVAQLNTRPDPTARARTRYSVDGPFAQGRLPAATDIDGFALVAMFQYGADAELYALYASRESEIVRANLCHLRAALLALVPIDMTTLQPATSRRYLIDHGDLFARVPTDLSFTVRAPCRPSFAITPQVRSRPGRTDEVDIRIRINRVEVAAEKLAAGASGTRRIFEAAAVDAGGEYKLELSAHAQEAGPTDLWISWGNPQAQAGEALEPADFMLTCPAWTRRIEAAERIDSH